MVRLPIRFRYHATFCADDPKSATPAPARVILDVDPYTNGRFACPWRAHAVTMLAISIRSAVRWCTA